MPEKTFVVAEEIPCANSDPECSSVHWKCPFCPGHGSADTADFNLTEYFSVNCHIAGQTFLVHRNDSLRQVHSA